MKKTNIGSFRLLEPIIEMDGLIRGKFDGPLITIIQREFMITSFVSGNIGGGGFCVPYIFSDKYGEMASLANLMKK